jgi:hypothetical protein
MVIEDRPDDLDERKGQDEIDEAIEGLKAPRQRIGKMTIDEILSSIHEGHKY